MSVRMRKKKNIVPRLAACESVTARANGNAGVWRTLFIEPSAKLCLEIGCGKGKFITDTAAKYPEVSFVALERVPEAAVMAMEKAMRAGLKNVLFVVADAADIEEYFAPGELDRIYINFCDPWTPRRQAKRRLTYRKFLQEYDNVLAPKGEIFFKTDNKKLFEFSINEMSEYGLRFKNLALDLHDTDYDNVTTEYEEKFSSMGMPIYRLEAMRFDEFVPEPRKKDGRENDNDKDADI